MFSSPQTTQAFLWCKKQVVLYALSFQLGCDSPDLKCVLAQARLQVVFPFLFGRSLKENSLEHTGQVLVIKLLLLRLLAPLSKWSVENPLDSMNFLAFLLLFPFIGQPKNLHTSLRDFNSRNSL